MRKVWLLLFLGILVAGFIFFKSCTTESSAGNTVLLVEENAQGFRPGPSALRLGLEIDVTSFEPTLNKNLDEAGWLVQEENMEVNNELALSYRVRKDGSAMLYPQDGRLNMDLPLLVEIKAKARAPIAVPISKNYDMTSKLSLHSEIEIDYQPDWSLQTNIKTDYTISEAPEIRVLGKTVTFGTQLENSLKEAIPMINEEIENQITALIDTRGIAENIWDTFRVPYHITNEPFDMWATLFPKQAEATAIKPSGPGIVGTQFQISSTAGVFLGNEPIPECRDELPTVTKIKKTETPYSEVNIPLFLEIDAMEKYLNNTYKTVEITVPKRKEPIQLSNFSVQQGNQKLKLTAAFTSGKINGILNLNGTPKYNKETETLFLDNIELSTNSNNFLVDQIVRLLKDNKTLKESLQYKLTEDISKLTFELTSLIQSYTIGEYTKMDGYIDKITVKDVLIQPNFIVLDTEIKGQLKCTVGILN